MTAFNVINPDNYDPTPLSESIKKLSDKSQPVKDEIIASLVAKYMV
jgi:hypothetical protein